MRKQQNKIKKILGIIVLGLWLSTNANALSDLDQSKIYSDDETNKIFVEQDMSYFINLGYSIVLQETRGIRTAWVLKKGKSYIGCRTESLSIKETCYEINLIKEKN